MTPIIKEYMELFENLFQSYKREPAWYKLKSMFNVTLNLGIEIGKETVIRSMSLSKGEQEPSPCIIRDSRPTPVALTYLLEIYKHGEIDFDDENDTKKVVANLREFCNYNRLDLKFSKAENKVRLVR